MTGGAQPGKQTLPGLQCTDEGLTGLMLLHKVCQPRWSAQHYSQQSLAPCMQTFLAKNVLASSVSASVKLTVND